MLLQTLRIKRALGTTLKYLKRTRQAHTLEIQEHRQLMSDFCRDMSSALGLELQYSGTICDTPALLTPNHISWHDVFAIGLTASPHFVAKAEVADWPLFGYLGKQGDTLFIDRGNRQAAKIIADKMAERLQLRSVLVFPEGTTSTGETVMRFKRRLFEPAIRLSTPIQPIALHYYSTDKKGRQLGYGNESFARHAWRTLGASRIQIGVHFCDPFMADTNDAVELARKAQSQVEMAKELLASRNFTPNHTF